jgi:ATP-dependent Clp protease ATP-binding subunit ClpB
MSYNPEELTAITENVLKASEHLALRKAHLELDPLHLASVLFTNEELRETPIRIISSLLSRDDQQAFLRELAHELELLTSQNPPPTYVGPNQKYRKVLCEAMKLQHEKRDSKLSVDSLLESLFAHDERVAKTGLKFGLTVDKIKREVQKMRKNLVIRPDNSVSEDHFDALKRYGYDMVEQFKKGQQDPVIGRDDEIRRVIQILSRKTKNNPILIGDPGVGKTALVEGLAQRIANRDVPNNLVCQVWNLDIGSLVAGSKFRGDFELKLKTVLKEIRDSQGKIILFIDEIHQVLGAGKSEGGAMDAANLLKPMLARGELRCIGATTLEEYRRYIERDGAFERRFQKIDLDEPSVNESISILRGLKYRFENFHGVKIKDSSLVNAAQLSSRYISGRYLPDKAIDLVDEAAAMLRIGLDSKPEPIDSLERRKWLLETEIKALEEERDESSLERLKQLKVDLASAQQQLEPLYEQYTDERFLLDQLNRNRQKHQRLVQELGEAERFFNLDRAARLRHYLIPEIEGQILVNEKQIETVKEPMLSVTVEPEHISEIVSKWTGIDVSKITISDRERLLNLPRRLSERVIGQSEAVEHLVKAIYRARSGLTSTTAPIGSFIFAGQAGVGKTELARALTAELFDHESRMITVNLNEYTESHQISRLIGSPPGYVGHESGGVLTEFVRRNPSCVVVFDNVDHAHQAVQSVILQILGTAVVSDGLGRNISFANTVVILTTASGESVGSFKSTVNKLLVFRSLEEDDLGRILAKHLKRYQEHLGLKIDVSREVAKAIIRQAYSGGFDGGARPLLKFLENEVLARIAEFQIKTLNVKQVTLSVGGGELVVSD